jgi:hypothetical protein
LLLSLLRPLPSLLRIIFHVVFHSEAGLSVYQLFAVPNLVFPSTIKAFNNSVHTGQSQQKFAALGIFLGDFLSFSIALGSMRHIRASWSLRGPPALNHHLFSGLDPQGFRPWSHCCCSLLLVTGLGTIHPFASPKVGVLGAVRVTIEPLDCARSFFVAEASSLFD